MDDILGQPAREALSETVRRVTVKPAVAAHRSSAVSFV